MDVVSIVISVVGGCIAIIGSMIAMMLWVRSEANSDRRDIVNLIIVVKDEIQAIHLEMKDFHGRLCEIEKNRGKL